MTSRVTNIRAGPIFSSSSTHNPSSASGRCMALVTVTATATWAFSFTTARCPNCKTGVMSVPHAVHLEVKVVDTFTPTYGRVIRCPTRRCAVFLEVVERRQIR